MRMSGVKVLDWPARAYVFVFRGTPLLVQIFLIYYGLGQFRPTLQEWGLWTFFREPYWCAILALTLNTAAYASEIIRGGLQSVPAQPGRGGAGLRHVGLPALPPHRLPDRGAPGAAGLWQRDHPDGEGDLARLDHHHDGSDRACRKADLADLPRGRGLHRRRR